MFQSFEKLTIFILLSNLLIFFRESVHNQSAAAIILFDKLPLEIAPVFAAAKTEDGARIFSSELLLTAPFIFLFFAFHA